MATNEKINQEECRKMSGGGNWKGYLIEGKWKGNISWYKRTKTWSGNGEWYGKVISGTWSGKGKGDWWTEGSEGSDIGKWEGDGKLESGALGPKYAAIVVTVIGFISNIVSAALGLVVGIMGWITFIISTVAIIIFLAYLYRFNKKLEGKWQISGEWTEETGSFVLSMHGTGNLSRHEIHFNGKMKEYI